MATIKVRTLGGGWGGVLTGVALGVMCHNQCAERYVLELQACPNDNRAACMSSAAIMQDLCDEACAQDTTHLELEDNLELKDPLSE